MVMSTGQLARCLSMNPKVISRMRQENRFPIKAKEIGSKIVYPLDTIARYLCDEEPEPAFQVAPIATKIEPPRRRSARRQAPIPDLSRKMLTRAFVSNFESHIRAMEHLVTFFNRKLASDDLQASLRRHDGKTPDINSLKQ